MSEAWLDELRRQVRRREDPWVVLEGRHAVEAAVGGWWDVKVVAASEDSDWELPGWSGLDVVRLPRTQLEELAGYPFHRGVIGLARQPEEAADVAALMEELEDDALIVVCPRLADASNVGAVVRNAAALGAQAVLFGEEGASPFDRKAVRSSSGGLFRIPVRVADGGQILRCLKSSGFHLVGAAAGEGSVALDDSDWPDGRTALLFGSEDEGLGLFWEAACDQLVGIPMESGMDSMNVAACTAVCLWQAISFRRATADEDDFF